MSSVSQYHEEGYCSRGHRQKPANVVIHAGIPRCRICIASNERSRRADKQDEERKLRAAMNREGKHGPELVRVPVAGWGCKL